MKKKVKQIIGWVLVAPGCALIASILGYSAWQKDPLGAIAGILLGITCACFLIGLVILGENT